MLAYGYGQLYADSQWCSSNDLTPDGSVVSDPLSGATSNRRVPVRLVRSEHEQESELSEQRFLVESIDRCVGCHTCEIACLQEHGEKRVRLLTVGPAEDADGVMRADWIVCGQETCDLCAARVRRGQVPACVAACPTHALSVFGSRQVLRRLADGRHHVCTMKRSTAEETREA